MLNRMIVNINFKPENPFVAKQEGVTINSIHSQAFLLVNGMSRFRRRGKFVVYKITHINSGKAYIGIATNYKRRMKEHFNNNYNKEHSYLHRAIQKHNKNNFQCEIICYCNSWDELCQKEIEYIKIFKTKKPNGYNLTDGGEGILGFNHSEKSLKKMSLTKQGKSLTEEHKEKIRLSGTGRKNSSETLKKMSLVKQGKKRKPFSDEWLHNLSLSKSGEKHWNFGNKTPLKTRRKQSEARKDKKAVIINNKFFDSLASAAKSLNITYQTISNRIKNNDPKWDKYNYV